MLLKAKDEFKGMKTVLSLLPTEELEELLASAGIDVSTLTNPRIGKKAF